MWEKMWGRNLGNVASGNRPCAGSARMPVGSVSGLFKVLPCLSHTRLINIRGAFPRDTTVD